MYSVTRNVITSAREIVARNVSKTRFFPVEKHVTRYNVHEFLLKRHQVTEQLLIVNNLFLREFDRDGSGYISAEELRYVVCNTGEKFTQSEAEELIDMFDENKDGELSWEEFVNFIKSSITEEEEEFEKSNMDKSQENDYDRKDSSDIENNKL